MLRLGVMDDWQDVARLCADWRKLEGRVMPVFLNTPLLGQDQAAAALEAFDILLPLRERTPLPAALLDKLPHLRLVAQTGPRNASLDVAACTRRGVLVCHTGAGGRSGQATAELTIGLLLAAMRQIPRAEAQLRQGAFQAGLGAGRQVHGRTLGLVGLGRIGANVARIATALGMRVLAYSPHLVPEAAREIGAQPVDLPTLLRISDVVSLHLVLGETTRGILGAAELALMPDGALLINTSRSGLVDAAALLAELQSGRLCAALDVYGTEPLPADDPLCRLPNAVLTPHLGYATQESLAQFYADSVENILAWLDGAPIRMLNPEALRGCA